MITKKETRVPAKIFGLYQHDSGAKINYYEESKHFQCFNDRIISVGYGYGKTPLAAIKDAIKGLKAFDKEALIRELEQFAEEMRVSPAEAGSASVAADGRSKGPSAGGAVEAADAAGRTERPDGLRGAGAAEDADGVDKKQGDGR